MTWYSVEKIDDKLYKISEDKHWESTNMYYFIGREKNLLVDTGTGIKHLKPLLLQLDNKDIDVVITHAHWDHIGNVNEFDTVYIHAEDKKWLTDGLPIPEDIVKAMIIKDVDPIYLDNYKHKNLCYKGVLDIEEFDFEGLQVIHTPGHSPGSISLYDEKRSALITGDILYKGTIYCHYQSTDPVKLFDSIQRVKSYKVDTILSGHYENPKVDIIGSLYSLMSDLKKDKKLEHGNGLTCKGEICLQL